MPVVLWFIYNIYIYWIKKHLYKKHGIRILCCRMLTSNFVDINSVISAILTLKWQSKHNIHYMMSCVYCQRLSMISVRRQYALQHVKGYNSIDNMMATYLINLFTTDGLSNKLFPLCLYIWHNYSYNKQRLFHPLFIGATCYNYENNITAS